jgi:PAS domain S-box-containing protein
MTFPETSTQDPAGSPGSKRLRASGVSGGTLGLRLSPLNIALGYVVIGFLWIVASDYFLAVIGAGALNVRFSIVKGMGFLVFTGGLLYLALVRRERWLNAAGAQLTSWIGSAPPGETPNRVRVLIVDDDTEDLDRLRSELLSAPGVEMTIDEARSVEQGRTAILARVHDAIFIGHQLQGGSGLDLIHELHSVASGPMIFITKVSDSALDLMALESGAHDHLIKSEIEASWISRTLRYAVANWRAEREVSRTRQWYSEIVTEAPVGLFRTTPEGELLEANTALVSIFGADSVEDLRATGVRGLYENPAVRLELVNRIRAGEAIEDEDFAMRRLDGTPITVRMRMRAVTDTRGVTVLYGALTDVTAQLENERRMRWQASMLDQVSNAVIATDTAGTIIYWNRSAEDLFGWSVEEATGRPILELTISESELKPCADIGASMQEAGLSEGACQCRRRDGSRFPAFVTNTLFEGTDGVPLGVLAVVMDLTDLRRAEDQAAVQTAMATSILESVHFPAAVLDPEGSITAVNEVWRQNAVEQGADLTKVGVGVNYLEVCDRSDVDDASVVGDGIRHVLGGEAEKFSHVYQCSDMWFRVEVSRSVMPLDAAVVMHIDITELRETARRAAEFAESKDRLIASVSHELRTPLTSVLGFASLLEDTKTLEPSELAQFASEIRRQASDMAAIVDDLLVAARAEMGALAVQMQSVDIASEIREVLGHLRPSSDVSIEHVLTSTPPVRADPLRLRQVFRNLVNNAVRYGGSTIRVESIATAGTVAVRVSDNGEGVPEHMAETIFEPFFSAHDRAGQPDALGLGLSVVRTLTEAMDGTIALQAEDGWTVFTVEFPMA